MTRLKAAAIGALLLLSRAACQTPAQQAPSDEGFVLRFDVDLVQVDAVVTDHKGNHVADLTPDDFEVLQDGSPQIIKHFSYVAPQPVPAAARTVSAASNITRQQVRRTMVVLIDDLEIDFADFVFTQRSLTRYIDREMRPGDLIGIVRTSGGSSAMQQLSGDPEFLRTVLRRMVWRPPSPVERPSMLRVLRQIVWGLRASPGRKTVIVISPGALAPPDVWQQIDAVADLASRCSVTIHTIDARSLPTLVPYQASDGGRFGFGPDVGSQSRAVFDMHARYFATQLILMSLADTTAGMFQSDSNDLFGQIRKAADDGEGYYLIGWYPGPGAFQGEPGGGLGYHNVRINVTRKGLSVRSRRGYYAVAGMDTAPLKHFSTQAQMREALFSPFQSSDINVRLTPLFGYDTEQGPFVRSLLYIRPEGIDFHPKGDTCATIRLEVLASALPLRWSGPDDTTVHWRRDELEACGKARERVARDGLVATIQVPIEQPLPVQMRVAVRNLAPGEEAGPAVTPPLLRRDALPPSDIPVGSAAAVLDIPDLKKAKFALSGVSLRGPGAPPASMERVARLPVEGDAAIRQFHPGDTLTYEFELLGRAAKVQARLQVLRDGKELYTSEPQDAKPGSPFTGTWKLDASAEPGKYLLGVITRDGKKGKDSAAQWIDFEVVK